MVEHQVECLWTLISFLVQLFKAVMKALVHRRPDRSSLMGTMVVNKECSLEESSGAASDKKGIEDVSKSVVDDQVAQKVVKKLKRRPSRIVIPDSCAALGFSDHQKMVIVKEEEKDLEVEGAGYCLVSKKGKRHVMEDGYQIITEINGDSMQAFFGVFDGHGGRAAVDFVSEKLGKNIIRAAQMLEDQGGADKLEVAIKSGYLTTDKEFLSQGVNSGACAATVLLKGRELYVSNVGDCRVVMSNKGEANSLTTDHRPGREDERNRIESLGGYVSCRKGVWRVQDSLAVSRAIGDVNMKEWVISEPETRKLHLTPECQFLIMASDGLWDKVTDQEAVDVVLKSSNMMKACKQLTEISCSRGSRDDITVMVVDLQKFVQPGGEKIIKPKL